MRKTLLLTAVLILAFGLLFVWANQDVVNKDLKQDNKATVAKTINDGKVTVKTDNVDNSAKIAAEQERIAREEAIKAERQQRMAEEKANVAAKKAGIAAEQAIINAEEAALKNKVQSSVQTLFTDEQTAANKAAAEQQADRQKEINLAAKQVDVQEQVAIQDDNAEIQAKLAAEEAKLNAEFEADADLQRKLAEVSDADRMSELKLDDAISSDEIAGYQALLAKSSGDPLPEPLAIVYEVEPNDPCDSAQVVACGDTVWCADIGFDPDEEDYYEFTLDDTYDFWSVTIETLDPNDACALDDINDTRMYLYGPNDCTLELDYDDDGGQGYYSLITMDNLVPGTYWALVLPYNSTTEGSYHVSILCEEFVPPTGRCCDYTSPLAPVCTDVIEANCQGANDVWTAGLNCTADPCPVPNEGDNCSYPYTVVRADLPYTASDSTCGRGNDYDETCLGYYDGDEDIMYEFTNDGSEIIYLNIDVTNCTEDYPGLLVDDTCPPTGSCIDVATTGYNVFEVSLADIPVGVGETVYIMLDNWSEGCFYFDISIDGYTGAPIGRCCDNTDIYVPVCTDSVFEADCQDVNEVWTQDLNCTDDPCIALAGNDCTTPIPVVIPAALPYSNSNTTCGRLNDYDATCLGYYDSGEDLFYELNVTADTWVDITVDPKGTTYMGFTVSTDCFPDAGCLFVNTASSSAPRTEEAVFLAAGTYYLMVDTWSSPFCIPDLDVTIVVGTPPPTGRCCDNTDPLVPICTDGIYEVNCQGADEVWTEALNCIDDPCPVPPVGRCCYDYDTLGYNPSCIDNIIEQYCDTIDGSSWVEGLNCTDDPCPEGPPANDLCANATAIGDGTYEAYTEFATTDGIGTHTINRDIWYCYTAPVTGYATAELCESNFDTKLAVWEECTCPPTTEIIYNDDSGECDARALQSYVEFAIVAGNTYLIQSGAYSANYGNQVLNVSSIECSPPANDDCVNAIALDTYPETGSGTCFCTTPGCAFDQDAWYSIDLPYTWNDIEIQMCPTTIDAGNAGLSLVADCDCNGVINSTDYDWPDTTCTSGYDGITLRFTQVYSAARGTIYWPAWIVDADGNGIDFDYTVNVTAGTPPPAGEICETAIVIPEVFPYVDSTRNSCDFVDDYEWGAPDVIYTFTLTQYRNLSFSLCNSDSNYNSYIWLYDDANCGGTEIDYGTMGSCPDTSSLHAELLDQTLAPGTYYINVDGSGYAMPNCGAYRLEITESALPDGRCCYGDPYDPDCVDGVDANECITTYTGVWGEGDCTTNPCFPLFGDDCTDPVTVTIPADFPYTDTNTTCGRVDDYSETCLGYYDGGEDIIYEITVTTDTWIGYTFDPMGTTYGGLAIDDNCPPDADCIEVNTGSGSTARTVENIFLAAGTYYLMIDTWPSPDCIPLFSLDIFASSAPPLGRCCYDYDSLGYNPTCVDVLEDSCDILSGSWDVSLDCTTPCPTGPPANDDCDNALAIGEGNYTAWTRFATDDGEGTNAIHFNVWYCYTASDNGLATISLCDSDFDTEIEVYDGCTCSPLGTSLAHCDDGCGCPINSRASVTIFVVSGNTYLIEAGGFSSYSGYGNLVLDVSLNPCTPPANDECANSETISGPFTPATGSGTTFCTGPDCTGWNGVWFDFDLPYTWNDITIQMCPTDIDAGNAGLSLTHDCDCNGIINATSYVFPDTTCVSGFDGVSMFFGQVYNDGSNTLYWPAMIVDADNNGIPFDYSITITEGATPVQGDHCSDPFIIPEAFPYQDVAHNTCDFSNFCWTGSSAPEVIYEMTLTSAHMLNITLCNTAVSWDTKLGIFEGECCGSEHYLYNDDFCGLMSEVEGYFPAGTYYVVVDGYGSNCGLYTLDITEIPYAEFDVTPDSIHGEVATYGPGNVDTDVLTVSNNGTDTLRVTAAVSIDPPPISASIPRTVDMAQSAQLALAIDDKAPSNNSPNKPNPSVILQGGDDIANATVIAALPYDVMGTTDSYTNDYDEVCPYSGSTAPDVVYSYTVASDNYFNISVCDPVLTTYDTKMYVYDSDTVLIDCCDDAPSCTNYQSEFIDLFLATGTYYIVVDGYGTDYGDYHFTMDFGEAPPDDPECPVGSFYSQVPELVDWSFATSDSNDVFEYKRYENFASAYGTIEEIVFWGLDLEYDAGWQECDEEPMDFNVEIYADAGGTPGMPVHTGVYSITPEATSWLIGGAYTMKEYHVTLTTPVSLFSGWLSIQGVGVGTPANCVFLWACAPVGTADDASLCYYADGDSMGAYDRDLSMCLVGPEEDVWLDIALAARDNSVAFDIAPGGADVDINVTMDAENLTSEGLYTGAINFTSNDPLALTQRVPVTFQVGSGGPDCYEYMAGDVNQHLGLWIPRVIGGDVTYLVNYFKGSPSSVPCMMHNSEAANPYFWASADANGDCIVMGSDVIKLVGYFRGAQSIMWCTDYLPCWHPVDPSFDPPPATAPAGWPNCEIPPVQGRVLPTGSTK
ncbi:MAG: cell envelope integrity protein TolA [candidate division Zixibacteria bacterium]|nr:cell envelope integrity protein TolA [candidate division Zixibacteria bacterium]